ncbi:MAG TPA: hypothetical protein DHW82_06005 [Spirochaetia bacterium]|nr:MAG: hypothetical protein A2Y41_09660 [Spirochaetes bacterium GWB1_36_13]HCL56547.1 hypothetical protein [Spirochaetia bacterium]
MEVELKPIFYSEKEELKGFLNLYWTEIDEEFQAFQNYLDSYTELLFSKKEKSLHWILRKNVKIGFVFYYFYNINIKKKGLHLAEFFLIKEFRKKGFGTKVLKIIENSHENISEIKLEVLKSNQTAFSFWEQNGFRTWKYIMKKKERA